MPPPARQVLRSPGGSWQYQPMRARLLHEQVHRLDLPEEVGRLGAPALLDRQRAHLARMGQDFAPKCSVASGTVRECARDAPPIQTLAGLNVRHRAPASTGT